MEPKIMEILEAIASAENVALLKKLSEENADLIASNPLLKTMLNGKLASMAYKGGVNTENMLERAEKNEGEIKADAEKIRTKWNVRKELYAASAKIADLYREMYPGRGGVIHVEVNTGAISQIAEDVPNHVTVAFDTLGESVPVIRHSSGYNVKISKKREEKTEDAEKA